MVTLEHHQKAIMNFIFLLEADEQDCWFQQDGAMLHRSHSTMQTGGPLSHQHQEYHIPVFTHF